MSPYSYVLLPNCCSSSIRQSLELSWLNVLDKWACQSAVPGNSISWPLNSPGRFGSKIFGHVFQSVKHKSAWPSRPTTCLAVKADNNPPNKRKSSSSKWTWRPRKEHPADTSASLKPATEQEVREDARPNAPRPAINSGGDLQSEHTVAVQVAAPLEYTWRLWSDLREAPKWMRWIQRVEMIGEECMEEASLCPRISRWVCSTSGFEVSWVARIEEVEVRNGRRLMKWATVEGLQSGGQVSFQEGTSQDATLVELSIRHSLPPALAKVMSQHALSSLVQATLKSDLEGFQQYVENTQLQQEQQLGM